jgi:hypothetical protein
MLFILSGQKKSLPENNLTGICEVLKISVCRFIDFIGVSKFNLV